MIANECNVEIRECVSKQLGNLRVGYLRGVGNGSYIYTEFAGDRCSKSSTQVGGIPIPRQVEGLSAQERLELFANAEFDEFLIAEFCDVGGVGFNEFAVNQLLQRQSAVGNPTLDLIANVGNIDVCGFATQPLREHLLVAGDRDRVGFADVLEIDKALDIQTLFYRFAADKLADFFRLDLFYIFDPKECLQCRDIGFDCEEPFHVDRRELLDEICLYRELFVDVFEQVDLAQGGNRNSRRRGEIFFRGNEADVIQICDFGESAILEVKHQIGAEGGNRRYIYAKVAGDFGLVGGLQIGDRGFVEEGIQLQSFLQAFALHKGDDLPFAQVVEGGDAVSF